ncbi:MAG: hypothetical protein LBE24_04175 [Methylobacillus sp.]|jgi:hypothetical protein|nr:hypothetical protein [Methylobacillus sp.]
MNTHDKGWRESNGNWNGADFSHPNWSGHTPRSLRELGTSWDRPRTLINLGDAAVFIAAIAIILLLFWMGK